jgi:hypothetical protein
MKKAFIILIFISISLLSAGYVSGQQMAKEGTVSGVVTHSGTSKILALAEGTGVINWEIKGIWREDSSDGPFHNSLMSCAGVHVLLKGTGKSHGYCVLTDPDGDKYLFEVTQDNLKLEHGLQEGKFKIIGGIGKFSGIQGDGVYKYNDARSIREEKYQERIFRVNGSYKLR